MNLSQFQKNSKYLMLALDHRGSFKKLMNPQNPDSVEAYQAIDLKKQIINSVKDQMSGILIDTDFGLAAYDKSKPFLLPIEKSGYKDEGGERITEIVYSVEQLKNWGASGAKLLIYFNPYLDSYKLQLETAKKVIEECRQNDFPVFLEVVTYKQSLPASFPSAGEKDHELTLDERPKYVLDSLQMFLNTGVIPDVFKLEYPGNKEACLKITELLNKIPWIILTRGVTFDEFVPQRKEAAESGCVGFLAGRALWQEVCTMGAQDKQEFLKETLPERFKTISELFN